MKLSKATLDKIELSTKQAFPNEMCGVVLLDGTFINLPNIASKPETSFEISPLEYLNYVDNVAFIIHSHTKNPHLHPQTPSMADLELYQTLQKPLLITALKHGMYYPPLRVPPLPNNEYLGRAYIFGVQDCGILARDYYHFELGIEVKVDLILHLYTRKYWEVSINEMLENNDMVSLLNSSEARLKATAKETNLVEITKTHTLQKGDILITSTNGKFKNHAMVWTGEAVLNQAEASKLEALELHINKLSHIYRHPSLMG